MINHFANALFGIHVTGAALESLEAARHTVAPVDADDPDDIDHADRVIEKLDAAHPLLFASVRQMLGAPADADFVLIQEDDFVDGGVCEPGDWLLGYGLLSFPRDVDPVFKEEAGWILWVTASG